MKHSWIRGIERNTCRHCGTKATDRDVRRDCLGDCYGRSVSAEEDGDYLDDLVTKSGNGRVKRRSMDLDSINKRADDWEKKVRRGTARRIHL